MYYQLSPKPSLRHFAAGPWTRKLPLAVFRVPHQPRNTPDSTLKSSQPLTLGWAKSPRSPQPNDFPNYFGNIPTRHQNTTQQGRHNERLAASAWLSLAMNAERSATGASSALGFSVLGNATPTTNQAHSANKSCLLGLPVEFVVKICKNVAEEPYYGRAYLARLGRVCSSLHCVVLPLLYREIIITYDEGYADIDPGVEMLRLIRTLYQNPTIASLVTFDFSAWEEEIMIFGSPGRFVAFGAEDRDIERKMGNSQFPNLLNLTIVTDRFSIHDLGGVTRSCPRLVDVCIRTEASMLVL
ncbi:hypothetical protein B0T25DRAFT_517352 [Lasiosphaeria hispida]|uniref:F-box domain-containing protein n=1 Tax=Lasiosphaeria hispida TaxID=260671 RepID=A0AAJ0HNA1_9PEZI|nr:hypothetical protein B0T25DRAFT_517352 [Lasiosphaeria hispida]